MPRRDPRLDAIPRSVNDEIADRAIRHLLFLTRLQNSEARKIVRLFDTLVIPDVLAQIEKRLATIQRQGYDTGPATTARLQRLAASLDKITRDFARQANKQSAASLLDLAKSEVGFESSMIQSTLPIKFEMELPPVSVLQHVVKKQPFDGRVLGDWWTGLARGTRDGIMQQVTIGLVNGESSTRIGSRLRTNSFVSARRNAQAVAHSAVISVSASTREELYKRNTDLIKGVRWVSTLDNLTCPQCGSLDGQTFPVDEGIRPPAHVRCRCTTVPVTKSFREMGIDLDDVPVGSRASMNGQVPGDITYNQWLRRQPVAVQNEALGVRKATLFREGNLPVSKFVNREGRVFTLDDIARRESDVFNSVFPDKFKAASYAKRFDQAGVTEADILKKFSGPTIADVKGAVRRNKGLEATQDIHRRPVSGLNKMHYTPERRKLHRKIINEILDEETILRATPKAGVAPRFVTLGGRGGSGKSYLTRKGSVKGLNTKEFVVLDADAIKQRLPEFRGFNAFQLHEESSDIFEALTRRARKRGLNIVHDSTLKSTTKAVRRVEQFVGHGYKIEGYYMHLPRQEAAARAVSRFLGRFPTARGRFVPPQVVLENINNEASFDALRPFFSRWGFWDNNVPKGTLPKFISGNL